MLYYTTLYYTILYNTALYSTLPYCIVLNCTELLFSVRPELRVVWADEFNNPDAIRMSMRLVEDSIHGTYVFN